MTDNKTHTFIINDKELKLEVKDNVLIMTEKSGDGVEKHILSIDTLLSIGFANKIIALCDDKKGRY